MRRSSLAGVLAAVALAGAIAGGCAGDDPAQTKTEDIAATTSNSAPPVRHFERLGLSCANADLVEGIAPVHICVTPKNFGAAVERPHANVICYAEDSGQEFPISSIRSDGAVHPGPRFPDACQRTLEASGLEIPPELPRINEQEVLAFCERATRQATNGRLRVTTDPVPDWMNVTPGHWQYLVFVSALDLQRSDETFADRGLEQIELPSSVAARTEGDKSFAYMQHRLLANRLRALGFDCRGRTPLDMSEMPDLSNLTAVPPRSPPAAADPAPAPGIAPPTPPPAAGDRSKLAKAKRLVKQRLKLPYISDNLWDERYSLNALSANSGASVHVLAFFVDGKFVGSEDEFKLPGRVEGLARRSDHEMQFEYSTYTADDANCCPTGPSGVVRFVWDGRKLEALIDLD